MNLLGGSTRNLLELPQQQMLGRKKTVKQVFTMDQNELDGEIQNALGQVKD